ncbi:uncharacterized protein PG998_012830 [Apiospora kogelbergensis]|uniref:uncharacterized protein n=1 Tax=Apiospora kogelbergensis TaxID=1337665 RepID=UPI00312F44E2
MMNLPVTSAAAPRIQCAPMPQLAEARSREDDWTGTKDAAARRRAQTRLNTRAYRKRKALEKKGEAIDSTSVAVTQSEALVECWNMEKQSVSVIPASRAKQLYDARKPLVSSIKRGKAGVDVLFPLCPDHLITLLQLNALRALAVNRTLISGILATPLDCETETIHVVAYPRDPRRLPPSLLPTALQQTVPHGDWIDIFPSPEARDALIRAVNDKTMDEDELWADCIGGLYEGFPDDEIERRGVVAWSPPWDIAGWEMSEGFLRKWGWLFGVVPGALEATNRWRRERGRSRSTSPSARRPRRRSDL